MSVKFSENPTSFSADNKDQKNTGSGIIAGLIVSNTALPAARTVCRSTISPKMAKLNATLTKDEVHLINTAFDNAVNKSKIANKGVRILRAVDEETVKTITGEMVDKTIKNSKLLNRLCSANSNLEEALKSKLYKKTFNNINSAKEGRNAFFHIGANSIILSEKGKGLQLAPFHELGHAMNKNFGKFSKILQKARGPIQAYGGLAILLSALTYKDQANVVDENGEKKKGVRQFIKNHVGVLASLTILPTVIEEGIASFKGNKMAKEALSNAPNLLKKVKSNNALGLATYGLLAITTGLAAHFAVKIKDDLQEAQDVKKKA